MKPVYAFSGSPLYFEKKNNNKKTNKKTNKKQNKQFHRKGHLPLTKLTGAFISRTLRQILIIDSPPPTFW